MLMWTEKVPVKKGWYWAIDKHLIEDIGKIDPLTGTKCRPFIVEIEELSLITQSVLWANVPIIPGQLIQTPQKPGELNFFWAGPIVEPKALTNQRTR